MKPTIEQIKNELREIIELEKLATPGEWSNAANFVGHVKDHCGIADCFYREDSENDSNATFIARSRNLTPKMAKSLLELITYLEVCAIPTDEAKKQLESIRENWQ